MNICGIWTLENMCGMFVLRCFCHHELFKRTSIVCVACTRENSDRCFGANSLLIILWSCLIRAALTTFFIFHSTQINECDYIGCEIPGLDATISMPRYCAVIFVDFGAVATDAVCDRWLNTTFCTHFNHFQPNIHHFSRSNESHLHVFDAITPIMCNNTSSNDC